MIDQLLAAKAFPNGNAVRQRILCRINTPDNVWYEVIGVVAHQRLSSLADPGREQLYITNGPLGYRAMQGWALRVTGDPARYAAQVRAAIGRFDRSMLLTHVETMDAILERAQAGTRFSLVLIVGFAAIATLLAGLGLYGVLSTVVRQRTAEIGIRMALGAAPRGIFGLMVGYGIRLSAIGIGVGFLAALLLTRAIATMLVGIKPTDPVTFVGMATIFFLVAAMATWRPARRAATLDPSTALREE